MRDKRGAHKVLVGKPAGKGPHEKLRCRRKNSIKMDLHKVGWGGMDWVYLVQDGARWWALPNAVMFHKMGGIS